MKQILCIDLDGTFITNDLTKGTVWLLLKKRPLFFLSQCLFYLFMNRPLFKRKVFENITYDEVPIQINSRLLNHLQKREKMGYEIYLATGSHFLIVNPFLDHIREKHGFEFKGVFCSDDAINLVGAKKAQKLSSLFGKRGFIYYGNSSQDIPVFEQAFSFGIVNPSPSVKRYAISNNDRLVFRLD